MQRIWLLNGNNINYDKDVTAGILALADAWVIEWLGITGSGAGANIQAGKALIECTRANGEKIMIFFENTADVAVNMTGTKKVYILVDQWAIDNGDDNEEDGTGIASIQTGASYPAGNFIPLYDVVSGTVTDDRSMVSLKEAIEKRGILLPKMEIVTKTGDYTFDGSEENNSLFETNNTWGVATYSIDLSLFDTSKGLWQFTVEKKSSNAHNVVLDFGAGTLDGASTYTITDQNERVTFVIVNDTTAKVVATANKSLGDISVSVEGIEAKNMIPWEVLLKKTDVLSGAVAQLTATTYSQTGANGTRIGQTFKTPNNYDDLLSFVVKLNANAVQNHHLLTLSVKIWDSISKTTQIWSSGNFVANTIWASAWWNTWFSVPVSSLAKNTSYYLEVFVESTASTAYYVRFSHATGNLYADGALYINGTESTNNDLMFSFDYTYRQNLEWNVVVPVRLGYKITEESNKVYRYQKGDIQRMLGFMVWSTPDAYTNTNDLEYYGSFFETYGWNVYGARFSHPKDKISKLQLKWFYLGSGNFDLLICPIDGFGNLLTATPIHTQSIPLTAFQKRYVFNTAEYSTTSTTLQDATWSQWTATENGSFKIEAEIKKAWSNNMDFHVLKNGVSVYSLTAQSMGVYTKVTSSEISVVPGDVIKCQIRCTGSSTTAYVQKIHSINQASDIATLTFTEQTITPNTYYGFVVRKTDGDTSNMIVLQGLIDQANYYTDATAYYNSGQDEWSRRGVINISQFGKLTVNFGVGIRTNNASYVAKCQVRQAGMVLWETTTTSITTVNQTSGNIVIDAQDGPLEYWHWGDYDVETKDFFVNIANTPSLRYESTTGIGGINTLEMGVLYNRMMSEKTILPVKVATAWVLTIADTVITGKNYFIDQYNLLRVVENNGANIRFGKAIWSNKVLIDRVSIIAGTLLVAQALTERSLGNYNTPTKMKEIEIENAGTYTVKHLMKTDAGTGNSRIYKNDVAFGTTRTSTSTTYVEYSEDLYFDQGDKLQLWGWHSTENNLIFVDDLKVSCNFVDQNCDMPDVLID